MYYNMRIRLLRGLVETDYKEEITSFEITTPISNLDNMKLVNAAYDMGIEIGKAVAKLYYTAAQRVDFVECSLVKQCGYDYVIEKEDDK